MTRNKMKLPPRHRKQQPKPHQPATAKSKRILHVQVSGSTAFDDLKTVGEQFAKAATTGDNSVITTTSNVQAYALDLAADHPIAGVWVTTAISVETLARVVHEVNRAYSAQVGLNVEPSFDDATDAQRQSLVRGVNAKLRFNLTPEQGHEAWVEDKLKNGWVWGPVKNEDKKEHPCLVPYEQLDQAQQVKDFLFSAVVRSLAHALPQPSPVVRDVEIFDPAASVAPSWVRVPFTALVPNQVFRFPEAPHRLLRTASALYTKYEGATAVHTIDIQEIKLKHESQPQPESKSTGIEFTAEDLAAIEELANSERQEREPFSAENGLI